MLEFDGIEWSLIAQPTNKSSILSLYVDVEGVVYVGARNEFGYIKNSLNGQKYYVSLLDKIPEKYRQCDAILEIFETSSGISFLSARAVFTYSKNSVSIISHSKDFVSFSKVSDSILIQDKLHNIFVVKEKTLKQVLVNEKINSVKIKKIFTDKDGELFFYSLLDKFSNLHSNRAIPISLNNLLIGDEALCFKQLRGGSVAIGTVLSGISIIDENKNPVQVINKASGLQNNTILSIGTDDSGNLWVANGSG